MSYLFSIELNRFSLPTFSALSRNPHPEVIQNVFADNRL